VWDKWIELYGRNLDAFYPVADTEIGRLGFLMANEGSYPENARGLAMNGAEVVYRGPYPHPHVGNTEQYQLIYEDPVTRRTCTWTAPRTTTRSTGVRSSTSRSS